MFNFADELSPKLVLVNCLVNELSLKLVNCLVNELSPKQVLVNCLVNELSFPHLGATNLSRHILKFPI